MFHSITHSPTLDKETSVAQWLSTQLQRKSLTLDTLQQQFCPLLLKSDATVSVEQHSLSNYDQLLNYDLKYHRSTNSSPSTQIPATVPHEATMAVT